MQDQSENGIDGWFQTVDTDFSPGDFEIIDNLGVDSFEFQTVDTDFSPGDTGGSTSITSRGPQFQTVDTDFSPGDW